MNLILGVDPGLSGALALYDVRGQSLAHVFDMPTIKAGTRNTAVETHNSLASLRTRRGKPRAANSVTSASVRTGAL